MAKAEADNAATIQTVGRLAASTQVHIERRNLIEKVIFEAFNDLQNGGAGGYKMREIENVFIATEETESSQAERRIFKDKILERVLFKQIDSQLRADYFKKPNKQALNFDSDIIRRVATALSCFEINMVSDPELALRSQNFYQLEMVTHYQKFKTILANSRINKIEQDNLFNQKDIFLYSPNSNFQKDDLIPVKSTLSNLLYQAVPEKSALFDQNDRYLFAKKFSLTNHDLFDVIFHDNIYMPDLIPKDLNSKESLYDNRIRRGLSGLLKVEATLRLVDYIHGKINLDLNSQNDNARLAEWEMSVQPWLLEYNCDFFERWSSFCTKN